ncbi:MAG: ferrous iron transporter B, partial [Moorella sp. (in: Bacteria)]|nr:ferrous iron transporter B [Moorella sp. (in: firmicutes)]
MPGKGEDVRQEIAAAIYARAGVIAAKAVHPRPHVPQATEGFVLDPLLASPRVGLGVMALLLTTALWLTLVGANYPSELLAKAFSWGQNLLNSFLNLLGTPPWLGNLLVYGVYRTASWVVAVMLPPMAIFFPCFTLLEDLGYLPRLAFTLDRVFYPAGSQGRQALTMCMGLGCNAA